MLMLLVLQNLCSYCRCCNDVAVVVTNEGNVAVDGGNVHVAVADVIVAADGGVAFADVVVAAGVGVDDDSFVIAKLQMWLLL